MSKTFRLLIPCSSQTLKSSAKVKKLMAHQREFYEINVPYVMSISFRNVLFGFPYVRITSARGSPLAIDEEFVYDENEGNIGIIKINNPG